MHQSSQLGKTHIRTLATATCLSKNLQCQKCFVESEELARQAYGGYQSRLGTRIVLLTLLKGMGSGYQSRLGTRIVLLTLLKGIGSGCQSRLGD